MEKGKDSRSLETSAAQVCSQPAAIWLTLVRTLHVNGARPPRRNVAAVAKLAVAVAAPALTVLAAGAGAFRLIAVAVVMPATSTGL